MHFCRDLSVWLVEIYFGNQHLGHFETTFILGHLVWFFNLAFYLYVGTGYTLVVQKLSYSSYLRFWYVLCIDALSLSGKVHMN